MNASSIAVERSGRSIILDSSSTSADDHDDSVHLETVNLIEIEGDIDEGFEIPDMGHVLIISRDQSFLTHGLHKFPAKFFPELPRYLIRFYSAEGQCILDPMCGSGTVVLEAMLNGRRGLGIDIDPIAQLIAKVKTTPIEREVLVPSTDWLRLQIDKKLKRKDYSPHIPEFNYRDKWFRDFVLRDLGILREAVLDYLVSEFGMSFSPRTAHDVSDFFRVILSSIVRDVSNADPHCTRTVIRKKQIRRISPGETIERFVGALTKGLAAMNEFSCAIDDLGGAEAEIRAASAVDTGLSDESIDLAVTSPPYINAVDYPRTHQLEMYWLGLLGDGPLSEVKRGYIGTETVYKREYGGLKKSGYGTLDPILARIYKADPRRSYIVFKFFNDMKQQFMEMHRILKPGARYCVVIGTNTIRNVRVPSHDIISEIATSDEVGFKLEKSFFSGIIRHFIRIPRKERMPGEWVLVLRKPCA